MAFQSKYTGAQVEALLDKVSNGNLDVWYPAVDASGNITWSKSASSTVPTARNIRGPVGPTGAQGSTGAVGPTDLKESRAIQAPSDQQDHKELVELEVLVQSDQQDHKELR